MADEDDLDAVTLNVRTAGDQQNFGGKFIETEIFLSRCEAGCVNAIDRKRRAFSEDGILKNPHRARPTELCVQIIRRDGSPTRNSEQADEGIQAESCAAFDLGFGDPPFTARHHVGLTMVLDTCATVRANNISLKRPFRRPLQMLHHNLEWHIAMCNRAVLDWLNFLLADVQGGVGPFLAVYLWSSQGWDATHVGVIMTIAGIATVAARAPAGALVDWIVWKRAQIVVAAGIVALGPSGYPRKFAEGGAVDSRWRRH